MAGVTRAGTVMRGSVKSAGAEPPPSRQSEIAATTEPTG